MHVHCNDIPYLIVCKVEPTQKLNDKKTLLKDNRHAIFSSCTKSTFDYCV
jgi:hypothetical protein